jgi:Skp family chaperone for outer membrane proteins
MKFLFIIFGLLYLSEVSCADSGAAFAVLDLKKVASESAAGKDIEKQIEAANNSSKKDLMDLESKIKSMESNKKTDYDTRKIEDMQLILYDMVRTKKYQISDAYKRAIAILDDEMRKIIEKICAKKGIKVVMSSEAVVYMTKECANVTDEVIKGLDAVCKSVKVEIKELK